MRALLQALALRVVPRDWRETVRHDLAQELARRDARRLSMARYVVEALRIGLTLRWRDRRAPRVSGIVSSGSRLPLELRLAFRSLHRAPWFAGTVVGVMALVLTLATVVFAFVDGVLFRPLPYPESSRLFLVTPSIDGLPQRDGFQTPSSSAADLDFWSAAAPGVTFTGFDAANWVGLGTGVNDDTGAVARIRPDFFEVIGVQPMIGGFSTADFASGDQIDPAVITWDLWQGRFRGRPDILGHVEYLAGSTVTGVRIVGVMPRGFWFPSGRTEVQFIQPRVLAPELRSDPGMRGLGEVVARVPAGMTADELRSRVEAGMRAAADAFPDRGPQPDNISDATWRRDGPFNRATVVPLAESIGSESRLLFSAAFAAVMVLVLLGALNASALLAARSVDREREFGVRRALGASRAVVGQTVVIEASILFFAAAALALPLAQPLVRMLIPLLPEGTVLFKPWGADVFDARVVWFAGLLAVVLALQAAIWPMWSAWRAVPAPAGALGRGSERRGHGRFIVVAAQTAGALVLTVVGALLVGSLLSVYGQGLSIRTDGVIYVEARIPGAAPDAAARTALVTPVLERLRQVPGVRDVALMAGQTLFGPLPDGFAGGMIFLKSDAASNRSPHAHAVTAGYYRILQPELLEGRLPTESELAAGAPVAVLSESLADVYWPDDDPLGQTIGALWDDRTYSVIGVVRDVPWLSWDTNTPMAYGPFAPLARRVGTVTLFIDATGAAAEVTRSVLRELDAITPPVQARRAGALVDVFAETVNARRFRSWLFGGFASAALVVVGVGILGMLAMSTARRTREVGIRQALGATRGSIVELFVREQMRPVLTGLGAGVFASAWVARLLESYLFGVTAGDPRVWLAAIAVILVTAGLGALVPSVHASGTDPTVALRAE